MMTETTWIKCAKCGEDTEFLDDDVNREHMHGDSVWCMYCDAYQVDYDRFVGDLFVLVRKAYQRDRSACGYADQGLAQACSALRQALIDAAKELDQLGAHEHQLER